MLKVIIWMMGAHQNLWIRLEKAPELFYRDRGFNSEGIQSTSDLVNYLLKLLELVA